MNDNANILDVDRLRIAYGRRTAIEDVTFSASEGDFVAVLGPNGSGKTSLAKALAGILSPQSGAIHIDGRPRSEAPKGKVGYVPQVKTMERRFPATAMELVVSGRRGNWPFRMNEAEQAAARAALQEVGGEHLLDRQLSGLSGGELQRIYLARSLSRQPRLVLLDEPATGIDAAGTSDLYAVLEAYQEQVDSAILMVTHDWNAAVHHATHVLLLNRKQVSFGLSSEVLSEAHLRQTFGHIGHKHGMFDSGGAHD